MKKEFKRVRDKFIRTQEQLKILDVLKRLWHQHPELRVGQLKVGDIDLFYVTDQELLNSNNYYVNKKEKNAKRTPKKK